MLIGLTGKRGVGKSLIAQHLVSQHGFVGAHGLGPFRSAIRGYYRNLGIPDVLASELTVGKHKDTPFKDIFFRTVNNFQGHAAWEYRTGKHDRSPGWQCVADYVPGPHSRHFMEHLGFYAGTGEGLGPEYTLGAEIKRLKRQGYERIIAESLVYESNYFRSLGGLIVRVVNPQVKNDSGVVTDAYVRHIREDIKFWNEGVNIEDLHRSVDQLITQHIPDFYAK